MLPPSPRSRTETLIARARAGDGAAFTELDALHRRRVLRSLWWHAPNDVDAVEDAVQAAFAYAFAQIGKGAFDGAQTDGGFRAYLVKAARTTMAEQARHQRARKRGGGRVAVFSELMSTTAADLGLVAADTGPETGARRVELADRVMREIGALPERHREVLDLRLNQELAFAEIAAIFGGTAEAAKALCHRAFVRLRERLPDLQAQSG